MEASEKVRENRARRLADRYGYRLVKSRSRDPHNVDYSLYALLDVKTGGAVNASIAGRWVCSWTLDDVCGYLEGEKQDHLNPRPLVEVVAENMAIYVGVMDDTKFLTPAAQAIEAFTRIEGHAPEDYSELEAWAEYVKWRPGAEDKEASK